MCERITTKQDRENSLSTYSPMLCSYLPKVDFKAPNADDVEENEKFIDEVLDGNAEASQKARGELKQNQK